eukprot:TRINITY_DN3132_c0_g1_i1.p1 TRINITY_DN3132_c0_g1~~TRINITY_DN3132_c0_g1_i1.p1  ORF type:complete len:126 (-),score=19.60 TRINITY_DN3132_c0_g1_i1:155-484(-)
MMGGSIAGRAFLDAYKQALQRAGQEGARRAVDATQRPLTATHSMTLAEAKKILGVDGKPNLAINDIYTRYQHLHAVNDPTKGGGSAYLQSKIDGAKTVIEEAVKRGESL